MKAQVHEIGPEIFRISFFIPEANLQFNQFLIRDEEPVLIHTGLNKMFPLVREAVATVMDPAKLRWIAFSHFEADECGSLNEWLELAPNASPVCSLVGALVSVNDLAIRPARPLGNQEVLETGSKRLQFLSTPHVPHAWDAGLFFEETSRTLFCSDLFHQNGNVEPLSQQSILDRARATLVEYEQGPFAHYVPYTDRTDGELKRLAALQPSVLATMHGSSYQGDGQAALQELAALWREILR